MKFEKALLELKAGAKMKRPSWGGYWEWDPEKRTILMRTKEGHTMDIRDTQDVGYTLENILADDWLHADETNTPLMGGTAMFDFGHALKYLKRGVKVTRQCWNGDGTHVQLVDEELEIVPPMGKAPMKRRNQYFRFMDADRSVSVWHPSIDDCLAKDWTFAE